MVIAVQDISFCGPVIKDLYIPYHSKTVNSAKYEITVPNKELECEIWNYSTKYGITVPNMELQFQINNCFTSLLHI